MKYLFIILLLLGLTSSAGAQAPRSATERAAMIHSYEASIREQATAEARELTQLLGLNESEMQLIREFATIRLQSETSAQALYSTDAESRHALSERAAAEFQSRLVSILNDTQMQAYLNLLAAQTPRPVVEPTTTAPAKVTRKSVAPRRKTHRRSHR